MAPESRRSSPSSRSGWGRFPRETPRRKRSCGSTTSSRSGWRPADTIVGDEAIQRVLRASDSPWKTWKSPAPRSPRDGRCGSPWPGPSWRAPDILLLDEPTNYLDIEARDWLEGHLAAFPGGLLLVSHDRYFLDVVVTSVAEIYMARVSVITGNYTHYEQRRAQELAAIVDRWKQQQEEIARAEAFITRFRYKASKARQVQSRITPLEKIERIEIPPVVKGIHFTFPKPPPQRPDRSHRHGPGQVLRRAHGLSGRGRRGDPRGKAGGGGGKRRREVHAPSAHLRREAADEGELK